jgi:hypothetical protein
VLGYRVLDAESQKIETSISGKAWIKRDISLSYVHTYWSIFRNPGVSYSEGKGMLFNEDATEIISWKAYSIGRYYDNGARKADKGSAFFMTSSRDRLAFLNNLCGVSEYEMDANGKIWEWK